MTMMARNWDRDGKCCKGDCADPQGVTSTGVRSLHCQTHTDQWEARLAAIQATHIKPLPIVPLPTFTVPAIAEAPVCDRCGDAPREAGDSLCSDCRHPTIIPPGMTKAEAVRSVLAEAGFTPEDVHG